MLNLKTVSGPKFELSLVTRDANGDPTGRKSFVTDDAGKLSQYYLRHRGKPKKKVKVDENTPATTKLVKAHDNLQAYVDTTDKEVVDMNVWNQELDNIEKQQNRK